MRPWSNQRQRSPIALTSPTAWETKENGYTLGAQVMDFSHAALAEIDVADGKCFVDQENLGIDVDSDREREPHYHSAGVGFYGLLDEIADFNLQGIPSE